MIADKGNALTRFVCSIYSSLIKRYWLPYKVAAAFIYIVHITGHKKEVAQVFFSGELVFELFAHPPKKAEA